MVFFATPGMLHGGQSLQTFKEWAPDPKNAIIIPGYCMPGTFGNRVLTGEKVIQIDGKDIPVNLQVFSMSFSAHADSKGIMELLTHLEPKNVLLVHGEKQKMKVLAENVRQKLGVPCFYPPNHSVTHIPTLEDGATHEIDIRVSMKIVEMQNNLIQNKIWNIASESTDTQQHPNLGGPGAATEAACDTEMKDSSQRHHEEAAEVQSGVPTTERGQR